MSEKSYKFSILTLGCKTNQSESDEIACSLSAAGLIYTDKFLSADVIVLNTCTVTLASDSKVRQLIRKIKDKNPNALLIVAGCYVVLNEESLKKENIAEFFTNEEKKDIPDFIIKKLDSLPRAEINKRQRQLFSQIHTRQLIKIQDGCRQYCAYCIVPFVRSRYISESPEKIIEAVNLASMAGLEEIVLTGTHIGKYGIEAGFKREACFSKKQEGEDNLKNLLRYILAKTDIRRIRLSSIEINELSDELIDFIARNKRIAPHLHIPLQSGSSRILNLMQRPYTAEFFSKKVNKIKEIIPDITLTTDVIVGFPQENEEDFYKTINIIEKYLFSKVHVFRFSPRPGTAAENMKGQVSDSIKYYRALLLRKYSDLIRKNYIKSFLGKEVSVLIERIDNKRLTACGMSEAYIKVTIPLKDKQALQKVVQGRIYEVRIIKADDISIEGELIKQ